MALQVAVNLDMNQVFLPSASGVPFVSYYFGKVR